MSRFYKNYVVISAISVSHTNILAHVTDNPILFLERRAFGRKTEVVVFYSTGNRDFGSETCVTVLFLRRFDNEQFKHKTSGYFQKSLKPILNLLRGTVEGDSGISNSISFLEVCRRKILKKRTRSTKKKKETTMFSVIHHTESCASRLCALSRGLL